MCKAVLDVLVETKFLCMKSGGIYARLMDGETPRPCPAKADLEPKIVATAEATPSPASLPTSSISWAGSYAALLNHRR